MTNNQRTMMQVLSVGEYEQNGQKKSKFKEIGVCWLGTDKDGDPMVSGTLDALPVNGKIIMKVIKKRPQGGGNGNYQQGGKQQQQDSGYSEQW